MSNIPGRKPTPAHLKLITGNPGHRPIEPDCVPAVALTRPEPPSFLSAVALGEWNRIVPELEMAGLLAKIDRAALAMYCQAFGRWQLAEQKIAELAEKDPDGAGLVALAKNDFAMQTQWLIVANKAQEQLRAYLGEFGMSPVSRTRVRAMARQGALFPDDPLEAMLRAGNNGATA